MQIGHYLYIYDLFYLSAEEMKRCLQLIEYLSFRSAWNLGNSKT